jgi:AraC family transcriptional regulator, ethanolamine operon transcriptional activator
MSAPSIGFPQTSKTRENNVEVRQSKVTVVEICDPTAAGENLEVIEQDLVQLQSVPFLARRVTVSLEAATLVYHSTNRTVRSLASVRPGLLGVVAFGPRAKGTINGLAVHPNLVLMAAECGECEIVAQDGYESVSVFVPPSELEAHLRARRQWGRFQVPGVIDLLDCDVAKARQLFAFGKRLARTAAEQPELFDENEKVSIVARSELLEFLLAAIESSRDYGVSRSDQTRQAHSHIVQIAEEWARTQIERPVQVADLCKATAASERTLDYAFKEILGLSPIAFLRRLRLHHVRVALRTGTPRRTTVSAEAMKCGFWHFGDFSKAYKDCFGESPSDTLRREPGQSRQHS